MPTIIKKKLMSSFCGLGWAGSLMSIELAQAGLTVRALEKGPDRDYDEFAYPKPADEYAYAVRNKVMTTPQTLQSLSVMGCRTPLCRPASGEHSSPAAGSEAPVCTGLGYWFDQHPPILS